MTVGYYDHHPLVVLERPVVVTGYLTADARATAYRLSALTGLRYSDVDRLVEHRSGQSIEELVWTEGEASYRGLESECLQRELRDTPPGVISLADGGLLEPGNFDLLRSRSTLVALTVDLANLYWRLHSRARSEPERPWHPIDRTEPESLEALRPFHDRRRLGFERCHYRVDVRGLSPEAVARILLERLPELAGAAAERG